MRFRAMEPGGSPIKVIDVHAIREQHVKVDVVQRRAKSLDEGDCTRPGRVVRIDMMF